MNVMTHGFKQPTAAREPSRAIHDEDFIYQFLESHPTVGPERAAQHYYDDGRKSAERFLGLLRDNSGIALDQPWSLLEFASGFGCVTRHLPDVLPHAEIVACDIHPAAMAFIGDQMGVETALSTPDPDAFWLGREFDAVFALSFFSHMPDHSWGRWLSALFRHLRPGGCLVFTTHGQVTIQKNFGNAIEFSPEGFWFHSESEQHDLSTADYGTTIVSTRYVTRQIHRRLRAPIALIDQGFWWEHQDVYVVTKP